MNTEEIINKLKYLGLDFTNIPSNLIEFKNLDFKPKNSEEEKYYKVYKYINVNDIKILITPTNRLDEIEKRYEIASPIYEYLDSEHEENTEKHTKFLEIIEKLNLNEIKILEDEQEKIKKEIPFEIKYKKDYLWQIYYSKSTKQYFMLAPINDLEYEALFYIIKKQIENKNEKIYVPICYENYSGNILKEQEIQEIEKELWLFANNWPITYEVYNENDSMSINIVGKANVYENIESLYKIELTNKEEAFEFYKLLKALFILQTELPHYYKFSIKVNEKGSLEFYHNNEKIVYNNLAEFIKNEYIKIAEKSVKVKESKINLEKIIKNLKEKENQLDSEYLLREKQISTYLECKKTFFGKVKYFFKYKKIVGAKKEEQVKKQEEPKQTIHYCERQAIKENYTLEEIINACKELDNETNDVKNLELDIEAIKNKNEIMENKIKNSIKYIKEIDKSKKSIFDFWRFTNKDNLTMLNEGTAKEENKHLLKKVFNYELDFEDYAKKEDSKNRKTFSKEELDCIFVSSTNVLQDINYLLKKGDIEKESLEKLKKEALKEEKLLSKKDFDIFGGITNNEEIKNLSSKKHREKKREKYGILKINQETTNEEYKQELERIIKILQDGICKVKTEVELPIYIANNSLEEKYNLFTISPLNVLEKIKSSKKKEVNLYKVILPENSNAIALTNIIYYDNTNKTLPLGMNEQNEILVDMENLNLKLVNENKTNIVYEDKEKVSIKKINIFEYKVDNNL